MRQGKPDIGYIPTDRELVEAMLDFAKVTSDDIVYDLGSGDGRVLIIAAQNYGARGVGIDIDPERIREANENILKAGVSNLVEIRQQDLFDCDFSEANVVFLYLLPHLNLRLRPQLFKQLKPGTRIISHDFYMGDWQPEKKIEIQVPEEAIIYYWIIPSEIPPEWCAFA
ncbi:MAG TPA: class I SAM-dependent methyltransferase [Leptolyngbyaceae cyanobacterium]